MQTGGGSPDERPLPALIALADRKGLLALVREHLHRFGTREALQTLRHPHASTDVIEALLESRALRTVRGVKKAVALHPAAPRHEALHCLEDLTWRDLLDVGREARTPMPVRRAANRKLLERLPRLTLGEKVSLARFADREVIPALLGEPDPGVFSALLRNSRLMPDDLVAWMTSGRPDGRRLELLARDEAWARRPDVREAMLRHRETPRAAALALLPIGTRAEWRRLAGEPGLDPLLAACAERLLENDVAVVDRRSRRL